MEGRIDTAAISNDVALRFRVEAGRETYLGRLVAHGIWKTNFLGLPFPSTATFVIEDALERDEAALRTRFPETGAVVRDVLRPAFSDAPAFVAKSVGAAGALESEGPSAVVD